MSSTNGPAASKGEMENEHNIQLGLLLAIETGLRNGPGSAALSDLVVRLVDFTNLHFLSEQLLMRFHGYPDSDGHEAEHDRLIAELRDLSEQCLQGGGPVTATVATELRRQIADHIQTHDFAFGAFLTATGQARQAHPDAAATEKLAG